MPARNASTSFGWVAKTFHWATVGLVLFQFIIGVGEVEAFGDFEDVHASAGVTLLLLTFLRLVWRRSVALPPWPEQLTARQRRLIHLTEMALYAALLAKPITGLLLVGVDGKEVELYGAIELPAWPDDLDLDEDPFEQAHFLAGVVLLGALACHIYLVVGNRLLSRMVPFSTRRG